METTEYIGISKDEESNEETNQKEDPREDSLISPLIKSIEKLHIISSTGKEDVTWSQLYDKMETIAEEETHITQKITVPNLTPLQRRNLHMIADRLGLDHRSENAKNNQRVMVIKKKTEDFKKAEEEKSKKKHSKIPLGFSEIIEGFLYLGSARDSRDLKSLHERKVKHILNCAKEWKNYYDKPGGPFNYHSANLMDVEEQNIIDAFMPAIEFIDKGRANKESVFVHCIIGKSRSASVVIAYLIAREGMTLRQAYDHVKNVRPIIKPNDGFFRQLVEFEMLFHKQGSFSIEEWFSVTKSKPKIKVVSQKAKLSDEQLRQIQEILDRHMTDAQLEEMVQEICGGSYEKRRLGTFLNGVQTRLEVKPELELDLKEKGLKLENTTKPIIERTKTFYINGINAKK